MQDIQNKIQTIKEKLNSVIIGKPEQIEKVLVCLISGGHLLLEDMPGVGKTTLASSIAKLIGGVFNRIQFTADLLPSDIIGTKIYRRKTEEFEFIKGPIFSNLILADELNRAPPKTQSALLQAMNDLSVSIERNSFNLEKPFLVIATQNPKGFHGTYPLPESQRDRFMLRLSIGYPKAGMEKEILKKHMLGAPIEQLNSVVDTKDILLMQECVAKVEVPDSVIDYIGRIATRTREHDFVELPVSPRGSIALMKACQGLAFMRKAEWVDFDHVKELAPSVLGHRIGLKGATGVFSSEGASEDWIREEILQRLEIS